MTGAGMPEPGPHPEPPPPPPGLAGAAKLIDGLYRNDGWFFTAMAVLVIILTLIYHL